MLTQRLKTYKLKDKKPLLVIYDKFFNLYLYKFNWRYAIHIKTK